MIKVKVSYSATSPIKELDEQIKTVMTVCGGFNFGSGQGFNLLENKRDIAFEKEEVDEEKIEKLKRILTAIEETAKLEIVE